MTDTRAALLNAAILGGARGAMAAGVGGVTIQSRAPAAPPRPVRPPAVIPPPISPPIPGDPAPAAVEVEAGRIRAAWDTASPASRVAFLSAVLGAAEAP